MILRRLAWVFTVVVLAASSHAATIADRSPFAQGHWWDPTRSGNGFDIFSAGGQVMAVWYTFDEAGRPTWYTAQGSDTTLGSAWPLLKHRWADGHKLDYAVAGSLRLTVNHPESMSADWDIGGRRGTWALQPFTVSGYLNEVDHTGLWYDPLNSGWGLTVTQQGDVLGGVLYAYDPAGQPTWAAGFDRGSTGSVQLYAASGTCPYCTFKSTTLASVGRVTFAFDSETRLTLRNDLNLALAGGIAVAGPQLMPLSRPASQRLADRQLVNLTSDAALKSYLDAGMLNLPLGNSGADFSAAPPAPVLSTTNLQEAGVDEADLVKSDGRYIYTYQADPLTGVRKAAIRVARVVGEGTGLTVGGSIALTGAAEGSSLGSAGLYLQDENLVAVTGSQPTFWLTPYGWTQGTTNVEVFSLANPEAPATKWTAQIQGIAIASRRIGTHLYVVTRFVPYVSGFAYGYPNAAANPANTALLARTPLADLLPKARVNGGELAPIASTASVFVPPQGARRLTTDMVTVIAIDLAAPRIEQTLTVLGTMDTVYASTGNLFVASSRYDVTYQPNVFLPINSSTYITDLHQLRLDAGKMSLVASGAVEGYLSNDAEKGSFRMSDSAGRLRVVTSHPAMWSGTVNKLSILEPSTVLPGLLKTVATLPNAAHAEPLGKPTEQLYATRFVGDRLYAVTFRRYDPLYVVDLANAADPKITASLSVPGFSEYLHPLPNGLLLGFGRDANDLGQPLGLQLALYDVRDAGTPRELQRLSIGKAGSDSALLRDHHAFSGLIADDATGTFAIPARIHDGTVSFPGAPVPWQQSGLMRFMLTNGVTGPQIVPMEGIITQSAQMGALDLYRDAAVSNGRSVILRNGTVYIGNGQFWRQDSSGATFGPQ